MKPHPRPPISRMTTRWIGASVLLSAVLGVGAHVWDDHTPGDNAVFFTSGLMFAVYTTGCFIAGGVRRPSVLIPMFLFGVLFPLWGVLLGAILYFVFGIFGLPQAIVTALVLGFTTRSWIPGLGAIAGLALGWGIQFMCFQDKVLRWEVVIFLWHASVVTALIVWVTSERKLQVRRDQGLCMTCRYDRARIAKDAVCPECGFPAPAPSVPPNPPAPTIPT